MGSHNHGYSGETHQRKYLDHFDLYALFRNTKHEKIVEQTCFLSCLLNYLKEHLLNGSLSLFQPLRIIYKKRNPHEVSFILFSNYQNMKRFPRDLVSFHAHKSI